jgi:predicted PurR-regulated permease PerM
MTPIQAQTRHFTQRVLIVVGITFTAALLAFLLIYEINVVLQFFGAVLLAIFLYGLAGWMRRYTNLSHGVSVLLVSILLLTTLGLSIWGLAPSVTEQIRNLRNDLPESARQASEFLSQYSVGRTIIEQLPSAEQVIGYVNNAGFLSQVGGVFSSTLGAIADFFIVILLAIYLAIEPGLYVRGITKLFPIERRERVREILYQIVDTLSWWLIGKFGSMLAIGVMTWIGLWIIGVPLSLSLGLIAGLLSFIPNFGPILSAIPAILLGFITSPITALYVAGLYVLVQILESNIITPIIERRTVELPPALTVVFQLSLGVLVGGLGLVLATPILAVVMVLVQTVYIHDILGDKEVEAEIKDEKKEAADDKTIETNADLKEGA